jgi:hypothetical protein
MERRRGATFFSEVWCFYTGERGGNWKVESVDRTDLCDVVDDRTDVRTRTDIFAASNHSSPKPRSLHLLRDFSMPMILLSDTDNITHITLAEYLDLINSHMFFLREINSHMYRTITVHTLAFSTNTAQTIKGLGLTLLFYD